MRFFLLFTLLFSSILNTASANTFFGNLTLKKVTHNVYAIVGPTNNRTPENFGNNSTSGFVVTSQGVVLIDSGGTFNGAKNIHSIIKSVTNKPITHVINTGGQDHRWLGNDYFKKLGATIIASKNAVIDQKTRVKDQLFMLNNLVGVKGVNKTEPVYADVTFDKTMKLAVGKTQFELYYTSAAHTLGDSFVLIPKEHVIFAGDIIFMQRLLSIADFSSSKGWIESFEAITTHNPKYIIPGHGNPTTLSKAKKNTLDYLVFIRNAVADFMDKDGDIADISQIDQSQFSSLISFKSLAGRNAQRVYSELEWE